jgi:hypothetical protein
MKFKLPSQLIIAGALILWVIITRTVWQIAPNFEWVTATVILAATQFKRPYSFLIPVLAIVISDTLIGQTGIFLFTWSGFAITYAIGVLLKTKLDQAKLIQNLAVLTTGSLIGVVCFYFWTNLGVVITSTMYPATLEGYLRSLVMALPFLKMQLISAAITTGALFTVVSIWQAKFATHNKILFLYKFNK